jgi:hypothetical protein
MLAAPAHEPSRRNTVQINPLTQIQPDKFKQLFLESLDDPDVREKVRQIVGEGVGSAR